MDIVTATPGSTRIGFIGTGVMGQSMAGHLLRHGYPLTVFSRTRSKAESLIAAGAKWANSPAEVAKASDVVIGMVSLPADVREVFLGERGVLTSLRPGGTIIDMATSEPALAQAIAAAAAGRGIAALDAPVSGGDVGAKNATLSIMVGGDPQAFAAMRPIFECLGKTIVLQGPAGAGQHTKMVNQILIAGALSGVCEAMLYARRSGLDPATVLQSVGGGAAASWQLANLAPRIIDGNFEPGFFAEHFVKDLGIILEEARAMNFALPVTGVVAQLFNAVLGQGLGQKGTHALMLALERVNSRG
ncbi:MAG: NAD(P)-dependent oxidoreductase [Gemmataceae bacterium]|nr:NAD(P)-dependent oxidoreductase [Gemmataceae bacterium]